MRTLTWSGRICPREAIACYGLLRDGAGTGGCERRAAGGAGAGPL